MKLQFSAFRRRTLWEWFTHQHPQNTQPGSGGSMQFTPFRAGVATGGIWEHTGEAKPARAGRQYLYDEDGKEFLLVNEI